jgi:hypothetical protein
MEVAINNLNKTKPIACFIRLYKKRCGVIIIMNMLERKRFFKSQFILAILLIMALILPSLPSNANAAAAVTSFKPVYITSNSYVKLENADIIPSSKGRMASFAVTFYNGGSAPINLRDYWVRLKSTSGTKYVANLIESDKTKKMVPAKSNVTLTFYSEVPASISLTNLVLNVIKFDFSVAGYEKQLGKFTFPASYSNDVKVNGYKGVKINNAVINMRINKSTISKGTDNNVVNVELAMRNTENFEVNLSNLSFYLQANNGAMYQIKTTTDTTQGVTLRSKILENIKLTVSLPKAVSSTGLKLVATQSYGEAAASISLPIVKFLLSLNAASSTTANNYAYVNGDYTYNVKVSSIERYSWLNEVNIISKMEITNAGTKTAPVPKISGALYLGNNAEIPTKPILSDSQVSLTPSGSISIYYTGTVPASTSLTELKLKLFEKEGETQRELTTLNTPAVLTNKTVAIGSENIINIFGQKFTTKVTEVKVLEGSTNNLYAAYMDVTNNQEIAIATSRLAGYLETASGNKYTVSIIKTNNLINASKKEQVLVTAELPKEVDLANASLVLGLAYNDEGIVKATDAAVKGYINAARYALPLPLQEGSSFSNLKIGAYNINIDNIIAFLNDTTIDVDLNGTVTRDTNYDGFTNKKFSFVFEDLSTNLVMLQIPFEIEAASGQYVWKAGSNYTNIVQNMSNKLISPTFNVSIYEEINGFKTRLVTKQIKWSPYLNWADPAVK